MLIKLLLLLLFIIIISYEIPLLIQEKLWREIWVFSILLITGFILAYLAIIGITLPLPHLPNI